MSDRQLIKKNFERKSWNSSGKTHQGCSTKVQLKKDIVDGICSSIDTALKTNIC